MQKRTSLQNNKTAPLIQKFFVTNNLHPYDQVKWTKRQVTLDGYQNIFDNVEFPDFYSQNAVNIIASKYFKVNKGRQEKSLKDIIDRVVLTITHWGIEQKYFDKEEADIFKKELIYIILNQYATFNSPVWFNVGVEGRKQQCSACFILDVDDNMESILDWIKIEGMVFKGGSGSGVNLSKLRGKGEPLSSGGSSSGPISFMRAADSVAGSIKSGGTTRRAAKMVILNADHPDIMEFINVKAEEENRIRSFIEAGYDLTDINNPLWSNIFFQNANNSVRIPDALMEAAMQDGDWFTYYRKDKKIAGKYKARDILTAIANSAWLCGDPGVQFDDTIQKWHTCKKSGRIEATNPCAEYLFLNWTSCNLASINLMKFLKDDVLLSQSKTGANFKQADIFDIEAFLHTVRVMFIAQDIVISKADYPHPKIAEETKKYRTIGLGYTNLGALLMSLGLAYDSDESRHLTAAITSLLTSTAYKTSIDLAARLAPFPEYSKNKKSMLEVMQMHRDASYQVTITEENKNIINIANKTWDEIVDRGEKYGFRNAQATVLAPTGTISFMMDCDTTGIEPDFALVKMKQLVGGGWLKIVNKSVSLALKRLGYSPKEIEDIIKHLEETKNIETAPHLKPEHLPIFDTSVTAPGGTRSISWEGHVKMVAAAQPFISGGISKTFNMPAEATVEDIYNAYFTAWKLGIKCFAVYRDGSKVTQALYTSNQKNAKKDKTRTIERHKLPSIRQSETHKFAIAGHEGYLTYSFFENGDLGEIFIRMSKQGSTLAGLLDAFSIAISIALQYGVPLKELASKFIYMRFEPMGITNNKDISIASSIIDYIFKYLAYRFLKPDELASLGLDLKEKVILQEHPKLIKETVSNIKNNKVVLENNIINKNLSVINNDILISGPPCKSCGGMTTRTGSCYTCLECGDTSGGCS
ncbi:MAG: vitamin B12-dependent ribonucleotide reductase [Candidatus Parcubacteria bacterium]|nr:MAG: vitamin B12-dependent ribonucleotide reductase [Candidatus Parcubacteria bacterium]